MTRARDGFFADKHTGMAVATGSIRSAVEGSRIEVLFRLPLVASVALAASAAVATWIHATQLFRPEGIPPVFLLVLLVVVYGAVVAQFHKEASKLRAILEQVLDAHVEEGSARRAPGRSPNPLVRS